VAGLAGGARPDRGIGGDRAAPHIKRKLERAPIKARLHGGASIVIGVDGNMEDELNHDAVMKGSLKFLHVMPAIRIAVG